MSQRESVSVQRFVAGVELFSLVHSGQSVKAIKRQAVLYVGQATYRSAGQVGSICLLAFSSETAQAAPLPTRCHASSARLVARVIGIHSTLCSR